MAEGVVIKTLKTIYVGSSKGTKIRCILKNKAKQFEEKVVTEGKTNSNQFKKRQSKQSKQSKQQNDNNETLNIVIGYLNKNRLLSVISKIGNVKKNKQNNNNYNNNNNNNNAVEKELTKILMEDALLSLEEDDPTLAEKIRQNSQIQSELHLIAIKVVKQYFDDEKK
jgi:hypothetical protein